MRPQPSSSPFLTPSHPALQPAHPLTFLCPEGTAGEGAGLPLQYLKASAVWSRSHTCTCAQPLRVHRGLWGQPLGACVCTCVHTCARSWMQLQSTNSCGVLGFWYLSGAQSLLHPVSGWRELGPRRDKHCRCPAFRLQVCEHLLLSVKQEGRLGGRVPWSWEVGVLGGGARTPPRYGGRGGSCAPHGHAQRRCRRCYGYRVACEGEGPFLPSRTAGLVLNRLDLKGTFGCWNLGARPFQGWPHVGTVGSFCSK